MMLCITALAGIAFFDTHMSFVEKTSATTYYVNTTGTQGAYRNIQEAIFNAFHGDTVFVYSGTYNESVDVNKCITLIGEDRDTTIINGSEPGNVVHVTSHWVNITGFSINASEMGSDEGGIMLDNVNNCSIINNNVSYMRNGIYLHKSMDNNITGNIAIFNSRFDIFVYMSKENTFAGNTMEGGGIVIEGNNIHYWDTQEIDSSNSVNGKTVYFWKNKNGGTIPPQAGQIILANCSGVTVENQIITDVTYGLALGFSHNNYITGNNISDNSFYGARISYSHGNNITDNTFSNNHAGITLGFSENNNISRNTLAFNYDGIALYSSQRNNILYNNISQNVIRGIFLTSGNINIVGNYLSDNRDGIFLATVVGINISENVMIGNSISINGGTIQTWNTHNIDQLNTVNGKPVYYLKNQTGGEFALDAGQVILANCTNVTVKNQEISNATFGITLGFSSYNLIVDNNISFCRKYGISLERSHANMITNNNVSYNDEGIYVDMSSNNTLSNNIAYSSDTRGFTIMQSTMTYITANSAINNWFGICVSFSNRSYIVGNNVTSNGYGMYLQNSNNITFHHNNIINNGVYRYS
jgi:parallel beta-helix repeat protein